MTPLQRKRRLRAHDEAVLNARDLRKAMSLPEVLLWQQLRRRALDGWQFRRQDPMGPYVADFHCQALALVVEIDGAAHSTEKSRAHDRKRDAWMAKAKITVLRVPARHALRHMGGVLERIRRVVSELASKASPASKTRHSLRVAEGDSGSRLNHPSPPPA